MAAENYSDVVQALAKQIVDTCMQMLRKNIQGLVNGVVINADQIEGEVRATGGSGGGGSWSISPDIQITTDNVTGLNQLIASMIASATIDISQVATLGEDGQLYLNDVYIDGAHVQNLEAQVADLWTAQIGTATIQAAMIEALRADIADIAQLQVQNATIDHAQITDLDAVVADITHATIGDATIGYAQIEGLSAGTALISQGVGGKLYIADLAVTEANMVNLTVGQLVVKGSDGKYYQITVSEDDEGQPVIGATEMMQIGNDNIADGGIDGGTKIIENSITASRLNVNDIFANNATVLQMIAQNINTDTLFANQAFINKLNTTDLSSNSSLTASIQSETANQVSLQLTDQRIVSTITQSQAIQTAMQTAASEAAAPVLKIDSSRGTVFKSNSVNTVLTVTIFHGSTVISNATQLAAEFGNAAYLQWEYLPYGSEATDNWLTMLTTDSHITNNGFTLTLTPEDVDTKITFRCLLKQANS